MPVITHQRMCVGPEDIFPLPTVEEPLLTIQQPQEALNKSRAVALWWIKGRRPRGGRRGEERRGSCVAHNGDYLNGSAGRLSCIPDASSSSFLFFIWALSLFRYYRPPSPPPACQLEELQRGDHQ